MTPETLPTLTQQIAELEREIRMRQSVYPGWSTGPKPRLSPATAAHRIACLVATLAILKAQVPTQTNLF